MEFNVIAGVTVTREHNLGGVGHDSTEVEFKTTHCMGGFTLGTRIWHFD